MATPSLSSLLRRSLVWLAVALAVALIAREVRRAHPDALPASAATQATAAAQDETLADVVRELVDALGRRDTRFVMEHVATGFKEERGLDYYDVRALVETAAFSDQPLGARLEDLELTPIGDGGRQIARARISFARGHRLAAGEPLPEGAVSYAVEAVFAKDAGRWVALTGTYRRESAVGAGAPAPPTPPTTTR
jgi:hypothetical protein